MSVRKSPPVELAKSLNSTLKPTVYDRILTELTPTEIPAKYIDIILIQYKNGSIIELSGADITNPIPVNQDADWDSVSEQMETIDVVKVFINTDRLAEYVDKETDLLLSNFFK